MILCYHKVALEPLTHWWVSADAFDRQLADLQAYDVVHLDDYDANDPDQVVITFDGTYANVAAYALPLLRKWGYPFEAFVIGDWVGRENTFDQHVEPPARFASLADLDRLVEGGGRLQWHTRTHGRLAGLAPDRLADELTVDPALRARYGDPHFRWFAYPHGEHDEAVLAQVRSRFVGALSVTDRAPGDRYALPRREAVEDTTLSRSTVTVAVANYDYGGYLPDAVDSVLRQSRRPDQLILIDDGSSDGSPQIMERYSDVAEIVLQESNRGIVPTFRHALERATSDYVVMLGADNRMRSDFVERCKAALDRDPEAVLAYTDMTLFGPRSHVLAADVGAVPTQAHGVYLWTVPDPTPEALADLPRRNFLHGSSMYRRADYLRVGGYRDGDGPEDHNLFLRLLDGGRRRPVHVAAPLLEYRQHSGEQANTLLSAQLAVAHWTQRAHAVEGELERQRAAVAELRERNAALEGVAQRNAELEQQAELLQAIQAGGWWRLRTRLLPVLRLGSAARRALRSGRARVQHSH